MKTEQEDPRTAIERIRKQAQRKIDKIMKEANLEISAYEAEIELEDHPEKNAMGFCHIFWAVRKRILREKYHINWQSPAEKNPGVLFD